MASTAWQTLFLKLENNTKYLDEDLPYKTMFRMAPRSSQEFAFISAYFYNFIIVRHPFTRLVSAYKDRIARCKMKAEWYSSGQTQIPSLKLLIIDDDKIFSVSRRLGLVREPDCSAESDVGQIILNNGKPAVDRKSVIVPTFRNERE